MLHGYLQVSTSHPLCISITEVLSLRKHTDGMFSWMLPCCQTSRSNRRSGSGMAWIHRNDRLMWVLDGMVLDGQKVFHGEDFFKASPTLEETRFQIQKTWDDVDFLFTPTDWQMLDSSLICQNLPLPVWTFTVFPIRDFPHTWMIDSRCIESNDVQNTFLNPYVYIYIHNYTYIYIYIYIHTKLCVHRIYLYLHTLTYIHDLYTYILHVSCVFIFYSVPLESSWNILGVCFYQHRLHWRKKPTGITRSGCRWLLPLSLVRRAISAHPRCRGETRVFETKIQKVPCFGNQKGIRLVTPWYWYIWYPENSEDKDVLNQKVWLRRFDFSWNLRTVRMM